MEIEVNKRCTINDENIATCRDERLVAISVTDENRIEDNGFINYTLAIEDRQRCCEEYSTWYEIYSENRFVKYIDHDAEVNKKLKEFVLSKNTNMSELFKDKEILESCLVTVVYGNDDEIIAIGICYNVHNGYYGHYVYGNIDNKDIDVVYF